MKDFLSTAILGLVAVAVLVGAWSLSQDSSEFVPNKQAPATVDLHAVVNRVLDSEVVGTGANEQVRFAYIGDPVLDKLDAEEVTGMRTESSWTKNVTTKDEYDKGNYGLQAVVYPEKTFVKRPDGWHTIEHGTAPKKAFDQAMAGTRFFSFLTNVAYAAENPTIYTGTGDGYVEYNALGGTFATVHGQADGTIAVDYVNGAYISSGVITGKLGSATIDRTFLPFDTSVISSKATITAATVNVYVTGTVDTANDGLDYITVVQTTQSAYDHLFVADFDQCGAVSGPTEGTSADPDITSMSTNAYTTITLNSTGRGWIVKNGGTSSCTTLKGYTCLGLREGHDAQNTAVADNTAAQVTISTSEAAGTANDPYMTVTYTVPQAVLNGGLWLAGSGGRLNVVGGGLKVLN